MSERVRIGWLTQDNAVLPLPAVRGSIDNDIWQLSSRLRDRADILMATRPHPDHGMATVDIDGIRYTRADIAADQARGRRIHRLNQLQRALRLPDVPYVGRPSYFRDYATTHAATFREAGVDVVHTHNYSQWIPALRRALPDARIVLQMHCEWLAEIPRDTGLERLRQVDRVLGVADHVANQVRDRYPEIADRVGTLPNGIDLEEFPAASATLAERGDEVAAMRARLGIAEGEPVVLFVGRISPEKGLHHLLDAAPAILRAVPETRFLLCGPFAGLRSPLPTRERREMAGHPEWRARYPEWLRARAASLGDRVVFPGRIPMAELPLLFAIGSVYTQPSIFEAFPLSLIEAMASELPVVASHAGGMPEQVVEGETGHLVPVGDHEALADRIAGLLQDPERRRRMGAAGRERIAEAFTWDRSADRLWGIYGELLGTGAPTSGQGLSR